MTGNVELLRGGALRGRSWPSWRRASLGPIVDARHGSARLDGIRARVGPDRSHGSRSRARLRDEREGGATTRTVTPPGSPAARECVSGDRSGTDRRRRRARRHQGTNPPAPGRLRPVFRRARGPARPSLRRCRWCRERS